MSYYCTVSSTFTLHTWSLWIWTVLYESTRNCQHWQRLTRAHPLEISISVNQNVKPWLRKLNSSTYLSRNVTYQTVYIPHPHSVLIMRTSLLFNQTMLFCMNGLPNSIIHITSIKNTFKFKHWYHSISRRDKLCIMWWVLLSLHFNLHEWMLSYVHKERFLVKNILPLKGIILWDNMVLQKPHETIRESNWSASNTRTTDDNAQFSPLYTKNRHHNASLMVQCLVHPPLSLLPVSSRQQLKNTSWEVVVLSHFAI